MQLAANVHCRIENCLTGVLLATYHPKKRTHFQLNERSRCTQRRPQSKQKKIARTRLEANPIHSMSVIQIFFPPLLIWKLLLSSFAFCVFARFKVNLFVVGDVFVAFDAPAAATLRMLACTLCHRHFRKIHKYIYSPNDGRS